MAVIVSQDGTMVDRAAFGLLPVIFGVVRRLPELGFCWKVIGVFYRNKAILSKRVGFSNRYVK